MEPLSALYRPPVTSGSRKSTHLNKLTEWEVDDDSIQGVENILIQGFDSGKGVFTCKRDGLYSVIVQIIPTDGGANVSTALGRRKDVAYCVHVQEPDTEQPDENSRDNDEEELKYYDVGPTSFAEILHLRSGSKLSIHLMPGCSHRESVRLTIDIVQRKRKRAPEPELTKKELRKLAKKRRRLSNEEELDDSGSEWSFSSDDSE